ncbi:hypothetical protein CBM2606_A100019 [Cupriavidus taiwanensis]|nr:hypothetical protein CBM2606_A100019 [Cupriavidus taiwanensis]
MMIVAPILCPAWGMSKTYGYPSPAFAPYNEPWNFDN